MNAPTRPGAVLKISFEHVSAITHPQYYCTAHGSHPAVTADQVPADHWTLTQRTSTRDGGGDIWAQYDGLRKLIADGELVRNVHVFEAWPALEWRDVTPAGES